MSTKPDNGKGPKRKRGKGNHGKNDGIPMRPARNGGQFRTGNPGNKGGTGRPPSAFLKALKEHLPPMRAAEIVGKIAAGDILEHLGDAKDGKPIIGETRNADRMRAVEFWADRVEGKTTQAVDMTVNQGSQASETGEAVKLRVLAMIGRALLTAPIAERERVAGLLKSAE